jgi:endonuclease YncB( thermonuclease family)
LSQQLAIPIEGMGQVLDGDTIQIGVTKLRLLGIDAFEAEQMCKSSTGEIYGYGGRSTRALGEKISGERVVCIPKGRDAFDRELAVCRAGSTDFASWMIRTGHELAFTRYDYDYVSDEAYGKIKHEGAWDGSFDMPWDFREAKGAGSAEAQRQSVAPSATCTSKGNVSKGGERIYHLPFDPYYRRTRAENWSCNIDEAERPGLRRAQAR